MAKLLSHAHTQGLLEELRAVNPRGAEELEMHLDVLEGREENFLPMLVREITESTTLSAAHEQYTSSALQQLLQQRDRTQDILNRIAKAEAERAHVAKRALKLAEDHSEKELGILAFRFSWAGRALQVVEGTATAVKNSRWTSLIVGGLVVWLLSQLGLSPEDLLL
jgi:hypothetical protein